MLPSFATETVQRIRPAQAESRGTTYRDWANAQTVSVPGCLTQPEATSSDYEERQQAQRTWTLWAPPGADIRKGDRIATTAGTFEVIGFPQEWKSPRGTVDHLTCRMQEFEG